MREETGLVARDRVGRDAHNPYVALRVLMPNGLKVGRCRIPDNSVTVWRQAIMSHKCRVRPDKTSFEAFFRSILRTVRRTNHPANKAAKHIAIRWLHCLLIRGMAARGERMSRHPKATSLV